MPSHVPCMPCRWICHNATDLAIALAYPADAQKIGLALGVPIHWTRLLDWTTGYWTQNLTTKSHFPAVTTIVSPHLKQWPWQLEQFFIGASAH